MSASVLRMAVASKHKRPNDATDVSHNKCNEPVRYALRFFLTGQPFAHALAKLLGVLPSSWRASSHQMTVLVIIASYVSEFELQTPRISQRAHRLQHRSERSIPVTPMACHAKSAQVSRCTRTAPGSFSIFFMQPKSLDRASQKCS